MKPTLAWLTCAFLLIIPIRAGVPKTALNLPRQPDGDGAVRVSGELKQWHKVTLTFNGPFAHEGGMEPNPFTDIAFSVTFTHESGEPIHTVPGYFAADGNAGESGAESGTLWRAHLSPDKPGRWRWQASMKTDKYAALGLAGEKSMQPVAPVHDQRGEFTIAPSDKTGRDFRAHGRLQYVGKYHLQFAGSKEYFLKAGPDAPETLLAYADFDGTEARKANVPLKTWAPHIGDWREGDPAWSDGRGKGLIGALNYLSAKGVNAFSFLTYNAGGDGDNVWPFIARDRKLSYDCSKLDQWGVVFDHATARGLFLHFKLQENEHDIRKLTLWGNLMAGGAGLEYYFGYSLPENDLVAQDFRSRDRSWDYCAIALNFFRDHRIPVAEMKNANALVGNAKDDNSRFCLAKPGELYLVYLPSGGTTELDLSAAQGAFTVNWSNPRTGGGLQDGSARKVQGGGKVGLGLPPADPTEDWLAVVRLLAEYGKQSDIQQPGRASPSTRSPPKMSSSAQSAPRGRKP